MLRTRGDAVIVEVAAGSDAHGDAAIRSLRAALDPVAVQDAFGEMFAERREASPTLRSIVVRRHKPGRRCLVAYECTSNDGTGEVMTILGKVRAKGADERAHSLQRLLWRNGFGPTSDDGVYVPEPLGVAPALGMWCQRHVPGALDVALLAGRQGPTMASHVAEAIHKLHRSSVAVARIHTAADELTILTKRLHALADERPNWASRLDRLLRGCRALHASFEVPQACVIHRDFYHDQVLVHGADVYLIDLDLCARGDPGVDVGNFVAHLVEAAVRIHGDPEALDRPAAAFVERYVELAGPRVRSSIEAHVTLALARHVQISASMPDRAHCTEGLLALTEERLA
ncbi:hypothetical protein BH23DEI1_BH23DEI1_12010 [soil metagenome]